MKTPYKIITTFLLTMIFIVLISCTSSTYTLSETHFNTMATYDSYIVSVSEYRVMPASTLINNQYIYIDSINDIWMISDEDSYRNEICHQCELYHEINNTVYEYIYVNQWLQIEVKNETKKVREIDQLFIDYFDNDLQQESEELNLSTTVSLSELDSNILSFISSSIESDYLNIRIPLYATYNKSLQHFTEFTLDLSRVQQQINQDSFIVDHDNDWTLTFNYNYSFNEFNVVLPEAIKDDYINSFPTANINHEDINSYDVIKGTLDYSEDIDVLHVFFDKSGSYQLSDLLINRDIPVDISLYSTNSKLVTSLHLDLAESCSQYIYLESGSYYLTITSPILEKDNNYKFIFIQ